MNSVQYHTPEESGDFEWIKAKDGAQHFLRCWPAQTPRALVLYLHGIEGHSLWFSNTASFLQANDISILGLDRRGAGLSKEARGDMQSWQQLISDSSEILRYAHEKAGQLPLFLMANCWGAKLAALLAQEDSSDAPFLSGLIMSSPAINVKVDLTLSEKLLVVWRLITGSKKPLPIPLKIEDFTNNPVFLNFIAEDKLRLTEATARFFFNTFLLTHMSNAAAEKISMPTLIVQSGTDSIVDESGVKRWFERLKAADKKFEMFPHAYHSLDFDSKPDQYRNLLLNWIREHIPQERSESRHENSLA